MSIRAACALLSLIALLFLASRPAVAKPLQLTEKDLPGWEVGAPERYSAKQLYGYINGGAEIYLEYGFRHVTGQRAAKDRHELQCDVYEMVNAEAAFGMFSTLRGRCGSTLPGTAWHCVTPEQILFTKGKYLVSIVPYDRSADTRNAAMKAARALVGRIRQADYRVPKPFRDAPFSTDQKSLRYLRGPLAMQNVLGDWLPWFNGIQRFDMYHVTVGDGGRRTEAAVIAFRSKRDADRFLSQSGLGDVTAQKGWRIDGKRDLSVRRQGDRRVHVLWGTQHTDLRSRWR
ncbi:MAG: hypothetical protein KFF77_07205 [Bacteroidetes bacterium]|nr:hypothetical protein [Bacteroidota bacterium]